MSEQSDASNEDNNSGKFSREKSEGEVVSDFINSIMKEDDNDENDAKEKEDTERI